MTETNQKKEYELSFITASEEASSTILSIINQSGGELISSLPAKRINLAYPIKKHEIGFLTTATFSLYPASIINLENTFNLSSALLRSLIVTPIKKRKEITPKPEILSTAPVSAPDPEVSSLPSKLPESGHNLSNEDLEKKLEEILN